MTKINEREAAISKLSREMADGKGDFSGVAFVSFQTENMKQELLERYEVSAFRRFRNTFKWLAPKTKDSNALYINGQRIYLSQAAEPGDVNWKNLHVPDRERYFRKMAGYFITVVLLVLCGVLVANLLLKQDDLREKGKSSGKEEATATQIRALTAALAISVVVINKILGFIMPFVGA